MSSEDVEAGGNVARGGKKLTIWQQNLNKSLLAHLALLHHVKAKHDIVCLQEPHFDFRCTSRATADWSTVYPTLHDKAHVEKTRAMILINSKISSNSWRQLNIQSADIVAIKIRCLQEEVRIFNIYNDCNHSESLEALEAYLVSEEGRRDRGPSVHDIWLGDFNRHDQMWDEERNAHLFTRDNLDAAGVLIAMLEEHGMEMALPKGIPTLRAFATGNLTRPDNVFVSADIIESVIQCRAKPESMPDKTDHFPIKTVIDFDVEQAPKKEQRDFRGTDWKKFAEALEEKMTGQPVTRITTTNELHERLDRLVCAIQETISSIVLVRKPSKYTKRWWTRDLTLAKKKAKRLGRESWKRQRYPGHPIHEEFRRARNDYSQLIKVTKKEFWQEWLDGIDTKAMWTAHRFVSSPASDGGRTRIPTLKVKDEHGASREVDDNTEKARLLHKTFFYDPPPDPGIPDDYEYPPEKFHWDPVTDEQIHGAIKKLHPYKAPGLSGISNSVLINCRELLVPYLGPIFRATFELGVYPERWKVFNTVVLRKPGKTDYNIAGAYRPIALLDMIAKVLSSCVKETLTYHTERLGLLPQYQFGNRPGRATTDSLHLLISFIKDAWRKGWEAVVIYADVKGAFPNTVVAVLIHDMRKEGVPKELTDWFKRKLEGRKTVISFDDYESELIPVENGLDQGCNTSGECYNFYSADQIRKATRLKDQRAGGWADDTFFAAMAPRLEEAAVKATELVVGAGGGQEWSQSHFSPYELQKFGCVGYTRRKVPDPANPRKRVPAPRPSIQIGGHVIQPSPAHKFLGVILDQELHFTMQADYAVAKGKTWATQVKRLSKTTRGMGGSFARQLYTSVALPSMLYAADVWCTPPVQEKTGKKSKGSVGFCRRMERVQRMGTIQALGTYRTTPTDLLDAHADILPVMLQVTKICGQAALRIATLPESHPLYKPARRAQRVFVRRHRAPLHNIMRILGKDPNTIEKIATIRKPPTWQPPIDIFVPEKEEEAFERERENEADIRIYTDGSGYEGGIGAAAVLYRGFAPPKVMRQFVGPETEHTVYEGECVGQMLGMELLRRESNRRGGVRTVTVGTDNQASIQVLAAHGPGTGRYIVDQVLRGIERAKKTHPGIKISVNWTPAHKGIRGNEKADQEAKKAAEGKTTANNALPFITRKLRTSKAAVRKALRKEVRHENGEQFKKSTRYARMQKVDPSLPSNKFMAIAKGLPRKQSALLFQLRSGHCPLNQYLHRFKHSDTPICPRCNTAPETVDHFLLHCPAYAAPRATLQKTVKRGPDMLAVILSQPDFTYQLFQYIHATKRFEEQLGDLRIPKPKE